MQLDNIINKYFTNKIGHAYLLKTNDINKVITIAKNIFSQNFYDDNIDELINNNVYSDLKIIKPDGLWIKKEQILDLQSDYKTRSIYNNKRIYIINNAENLNKSSGNTLLKFLEEPNEDIIAFLVTDNKNKVLDTLVSRCQYLVLDSNSEEVFNNYEEALECCSLIENNKKLANISLMAKLEEYQDRLMIKKLFQKMLFIYEQCLLKLCDIDTNVELAKIDEIISKNINKSDIIKRLEALSFAIDILDTNINLKLLIDKVLIMMFGVD